MAVTDEDVNEITKAATAEIGYFDKVHALLVKLIEREVKKTQIRVESEKVIARIDEMLFEPDDSA